MRPFCIGGGILQPRSDASGGPWDTLVPRVADERQSAVLAQIVRSNPGKSLITPTCVSTLRTVPKVSPWCSRPSRGSLSWSSRERAKQRFARQWRRACLVLCRASQTGPRCVRTRTGVGAGWRGHLCRPAWQGERAFGQRATLWRARGNDPRPVAESPVHLLPASRVNSR
jgi:hypothetical protein